MHNFKYICIIYTKKENLRFNKFNFCFKKQANFCILFFKYL